ncbi:Uncharacterised protein [Mycobacteroides abscessus subsp. massiliense]|nr:Uncharacterised protein [Mycobacteroides abscessus subsp. massiliense]
MPQRGRDRDDRNATQRHGQRQRLCLVRRVKLGEPQWDAHSPRGQQRDRGGKVGQQKNRQEGARLRGPDVRLGAYIWGFRGHTVLSNVLRPTTVSGCAQTPLRTRSAPVADGCSTYA